MVRVAFASSDRVRVDQHFGAAESFAIYEVTPEQATLFAVGDFSREAMDGNEEKLAAKVEFLDNCAAVYVLAIGASAIKQLLARGIQPVRINADDDVQELLDAIVLALNQGGVPWIERALAARAGQHSEHSEQRFARMEEEGWEGSEG
ncbi:MAG: NifB/NifX family molybdenum-iron cluster-binding protein [Candidatus Accumulibacter phosphatis]|jgi:nitrogen fixation protein NifX|uniref:NifB/NifX family molybdenum-iron cluster-binding protein n=1 Tax=Candidatus Accumulibacter sp. ACC012 TaxID=2823332 RepID=UPI0025BACE1E|nr:NifB/NifX family molybdenum-iron cluster-binding protein [Candidatus Accumulibacter sp. ACC012]